MTGSAAGGAVTLARGRLRLLTYNVRGLKEDRAALARVIRSLEPDIVCLQEVPRHPFSGHRVGELADDCRLLWSGGAAGSGGTAILTSARVAERSAHSTRLPAGRAWPHGRGFSAAVVAVPAGPALTVASVHFGPVSDERVQHAQLVLDRLAEVGPAPYVVAGDLGEAPGGPAWLAFAAGVTDAGAQGPTYPAGNPRQRIDAVLVSPDVMVLSARRVGAADGVDPLDLVAASDHLPVVADLEVRSASPV